MESALKSEVSDAIRRRLNNCLPELRDSLDLSPTHQYSSSALQLRRLTAPTHATGRRLRPLSLLWLRSSTPACSWISAAASDVAYHRPHTRSKIYSHRDRSLQPRYLPGLATRLLCHARCSRVLHLGERVGNAELVLFSTPLTTERRRCLKSISVGTHRRYPSRGSWEAESCTLGLRGRTTR